MAGNEEQSVLNKAISLVNKAADCDLKGEFVEALGLYQRALDHFQVAIKYEKNETFKEMLRKKMAEYLVRAEQLKEWIEKNPAAQPNNRPTTTTSNNNNRKLTSSGGPSSSSTTEQEDTDTQKRKQGIAAAIITEKPNVHWDDVAGLEGAKSTLIEAVIMPSMFPSVFVEARQPWRGILLYGVPGTGKTELARAVATEAGNCTFFNVNCSALLNKWLGESEKLVKELFDSARQNSPSVVFIDEIDSLCSARNDQESETSRRVKTEFLEQMNGLGTEGNNKVLVLAATNLPWALDTAVRRRFQKRIFIGLPEQESRAKIISIHLGKTPNTLTKDQISQLGQLTAGFSGSDISTLVRDAALQEIRKVPAATHFKPVTVDGGVTKYQPCSPGDVQGKEMRWTALPRDSLVISPVTFEDFQRSIKTTRPTVSPSELQKQIDWTQQFGEDGK